MTGGSFDDLRAFLKGTAGLDLGAEKSYLVESRLGHVWREAGLSGPDELVRLARSGREPDLARRVVDAMMTGETMFFRDRPVFDALRREILPALLAARAATRRLRIWSAAASTGQEAYSVAMLLDDMAVSLSGWSVEIVGTDISGTAIDRAAAGVYSQFEVQRGLPIRFLMRHFREAPGGWRVASATRAAVRFERFNLLGDPSRLGRFDLILCRNVLIYLDGPTKGAVLDRLAGTLAPDGFLCLGTAESSTGLSERLAPHGTERNFFRPVGPASYRPTSAVA